MSDRTTKSDWRRFVFGGSNGLGVVMLLGLLSALFFTPYVIQFESRDQPVRNNPVLPGWGFLEGLEYRLYDLYFDENETPPPDLRSKIVIIGIDQNSIDSMQQWPWPRAWHAKLINKLHQAGAKVIAFDVDFSSYQGSAPKGQLSRDDAQLVEAVKNAKMVVLPSQIGTGKETVFIKGQPIENRVSRVMTPFAEDDATGKPGLDELTPDVALNRQPLDPDQGARRYPLLGTVDGTNIGTFAVLTAAVYQKFSLLDEDSFYETLLRRRQWFSLKHGLDDVPTHRDALTNLKTPVQFDYFLMKYRFPNTFAIFSYAKVLDYDANRMKTLFKDKIVFVGATAEILKDWYPSPTRTVNMQVNGVELHAGVTCQLLEGSYIEPPQMRNTIIDVFGISLLSVLWPQLIRPRVSRFARRAQERWKRRKMFKKLNLRVQDTIWFVLTASLTLLPAIGFYLFCYTSFRYRDTWVVGAYPLMASLLSGSLALVYLFTLENAERRKVMAQVGLYLDPDIMETILAYPEEDYPRPRRTLATVMFTDLQGFTPYSETHSAEEVVGALNAYMSLLHPIIKKHHGSVDKYIGDAIMAYFGVPVPRADHATEALACAMEIQEANARFRAETGIPFYTRIGIHTGELIAGSIGSQTPGASLVAYTVIGDTVNLASRLEAKNKDFGSWILCSRATIDAAEDVANIEPVRATVKGKSQEVEMFIVRGPVGVAPRDEFWGELKTEPNVTAVA